MQFLSRDTLARWPIALVCVLVLGVAVLLPGLGSHGLWEPQERQLADRVAPRPDPNKPTPPAKQNVGEPKKTTCEKVAPKEPIARSLTNRAIVFGRDTFGADDTGRLLPLALLGLLTLLASAGIAMRLAGARAGVVTAIVLLSMPLFVFQSRQMLSEIGIPAGAALTLYGFIALGGRTTSRVLTIIDSVVALLALVAGIVIGFVAGGALLGLLVPIGAYAAAHGLGVAGLIDASRAVGQGAIAIAGKVQPKLVAGRPRSPRAELFAWIEIVLGLGFVAAGVALLFLLRSYGASEASTYGAITTGAIFAVHGSYVLARAGQQPSLEQLKAIVATLLAIGVVGLLAYELYSLVEPQPGLNPPQRAALGKAIVASGCWSPTLGAMWRPEDDLRYSFDSTFEQIAYGTFPWGILGPVAIAALLASTHRNRRVLGAITLAWGAGAWIAAEVFQRKVGFTLYAGFPALAIAIGAWLDAILTGRAERPRVVAVTGAATDSDIDADTRALPLGPMLVGLFVGFAILNLGKDLQSFTEKISSLLVGHEQIPYPKMSRLLWLPTKLWILILGGYLAFGFALAMIAYRDAAPPPSSPKHALRGALMMLLSASVLPVGALLRALMAVGTRAQKLRLASDIGVIAAVVGTVIFAAFWSHVWQPTLSTHLSSKAMFDTYKDLRAQGDQLVIMGDLGDAPRDYVPDTKPELLTARDQVVTALARPNRVFAIAPQTDLCQLHREMGSKPYYVIDDRNMRSVLLSNRVDGTTDKNPLRTMILHEEPKNIPIRPKGRVVFDNRIEVLGWDMPKSVERGDKFTVTMFYKVLQPVGGNWRVLFHFDGALRFNGDHEPIKGRCQTSTWQPGDFIVDKHTVTAGAGAFTPGNYEVWTGFFTGSNPNWKNMAVSEAPADQRDTTDRVKITTIRLE